MNVFQLHYKLINEINDALLRREISFIVMNKVSHDLLIHEPNYILKEYKGLDVLISESLGDYEFRLG